MTFKISFRVAKLYYFQIFYQFNIELKKCLKNRINYFSLAGDDVQHGINSDEIYPEIKSNNTVEDFPN